MITIRRNQRVVQLGRAYVADVEYTDGAVTKETLRRELDPAEVFYPDDYSKAEHIGDGLKRSTDPGEILQIPGALTSTEKQILRQNTAAALRRFERGELE